MPYIGRSPQIGNYRKLDSIAASFNTSLTTFNLTISGDAFTPGVSTQLIISIAGVIQEPETAYTVSGSTITFTSAPATGASFYGIVLGDTLDIGTPSDNTVDAAKLTSGAVIAGKIGTGAVQAGQIATGGVSANTNFATGVVTGHAIAPSANVAFANRSQKFTEAQFGNTHIVSTGAAVLRPAMGNANFLQFTISGNITLANPTTQNVGQTGAITIVNGGSHTVSFGSDFKFATGVAPTITASGTDVLSYYIRSANNIVVDALQAIS